MWGGAPCQQCLPPRPLRQPAGGVPAGAAAPWRHPQLPTRCRQNPPPPTPACLPPRVLPGWRWRTVRGPTCRPAACPAPAVPHLLSWRPPPHRPRRRIRKLSPASAHPTDPWLLVLCRVTPPPYRVACRAISTTPLTRQPPSFSPLPPLPLTLPFLPRDSARITAVTFFHLTPNHPCGTVHHALSWPVQGLRLPRRHGGPAAASTCIKGRGAFCTYHRRRQRQKRHRTRCPRLGKRPGRIPPLLLLQPPGPDPTPLGGHPLPTASAAQQLWGGGGGLFGNARGSGNSSGSGSGDDGKTQPLYPHPPCRRRWGGVGGGGGPP